MRAWALTSHRLILVNALAKNDFEVWSIPTPENTLGKPEQFVGFMGVLAGMRYAIDDHPIEDETFDGVRVVYDNGAELLTVDATDVDMIGPDKTMTEWQVIKSGLPESPRGRRIDPIDRPPLDTVENIMDGVSSLWTVTDG